LNRSFLAGLLPLSFALSQRQLRLISALGTGVLVGTALIVIIPEGIETLYTAGRDHIPHSRRDLDLQWVESVDMTRPCARKTCLENLPLVGSLISRSVPNFGVRNSATQSKTQLCLDDLRVSFSQSQKGKNMKKSQSVQTSAQYSLHRDEIRNSPSPLSRRDLNDDHKDENEAPNAHQKQREPHAYVGLSLVLGFILMYLIDTVPTHLSPPQSSDYRPLHISLSNLSRGLHNAASPTLAPQSPPSEAAHPSRAPATTIGLIIHAIADGIALGASTTAPDSASLGFVVFLAIMLHKAPAAFGLTSVLLKQGVSKRAARTHLAVFSLAAPVGAFATWLVVNLLGRDILGGEEGMTFTTGCVLLFSGGTFL
jgi:solute carrier family 39 (zinc transporter), member 9